MFVPFSVMYRTRRRLHRSPCSTRHVMPKSIVVFSDRAGQEGGATPISGSATSRGPPGQRDRPGRVVGRGAEQGHRRDRSHGKGAYGSRNILHIFTVPVL